MLQFVSYTDIWLLMLFHKKVTNRQLAILLAPKLRSIRQIVTRINFTLEVFLFSENLGLFIIVNYFIEEILHSTILVNAVLFEEIK
jgi:hypothetical protein